MYSSFFRYLSMYPSDKNETLSSDFLECTLKSNSIFLFKGEGSFVNNTNLTTSFNVQLLSVLDHNSWSSNDYDNIETNYITITITRNRDEEDIIIKTFIRIAEELEWILIEEDDEDGIILYPLNSA